MKDHLAFVFIVVLLSGAVVASEMNRISASVGPDAILYFLADMQRELARLPVALTRLSDEEEIRIGNELAQRYDKEWSFDPEGAAGHARQTYVERVGRQLAARARRRLPYQFHYIPNGALVNAFALPGGHIYIGGGMLSLMETEDELAAVLGHEIEHVDRYHCAERIQLEAHLRKLHLGVVSDLLSIPVEVFQAGYNKRQELEADVEGTRLAVRTSYSPRGALRLFDKFQRLEQDLAAPTSAPGSPLAEIDQIMRESLQGYFRSHPPAAERAGEIQHLIIRENWQGQINERPIELLPLSQVERVP